MTERQIEINKKVFERYPKTEKERTCNYEKNRRNELRKIYRQRLESEIERNDIQEYQRK